MDGAHSIGLARPPRRADRPAPRHGRREAMTARLSLYRKAEQELYKLDRSIKAQFYDFCHNFRENPDRPGLDLKKLKGESRVYRAKVNQSYRALLTPVGTDADGTQHWLVVAVRHRK